jgi:hypothetical protein
MKLTYRGVSYEYHPVVVETTAGEVGGQYRSRDWRFRNLKKPPVLVPTFNLKYRGVTYNKPGAAISPAVTTEKTPAISTQEKARLLMMENTKTSEKRQQSLLSRLAQEIGFTAHA